MKITIVLIVLVAFMLTAIYGCLKAASDYDDAAERYQEEHND